MAALFAEHRAAAIHRSTGGIQEGNGILLAVLEQADGVLVVVLHHELAVVSMVSEHAPWCSTARISPSQTPSSSISMKWSLST